MALRILHSADWQIGQKANHVASAASIVRKARLDAAREVVEAANREKVDALILAGDQFEDNFVEDRLVSAVVEILAAARVPVFVLPGNHDALSHDSIYWRASWRDRPSHVVLLQDFQPVKIPGVDGELVPAPVFQKKSSIDPTAGLLRGEGTRGFRIGVAHGSLRIEGKHSEDDFPIALDVPARHDLDYLALGHWHGHFSPDPRVAYSGTHETCNFGERNSGQALLVEIGAPGEIPVTRLVRTGQLQWVSEDLDFDLGSEAAFEMLRARLEALADPSRTLLRVRTRGQSGPDAGGRLAQLEETWQAKLLHWNLDRADFPSIEMDGALKDLAGRYPIVENLLQGVAASAIPPEEAGAALQLLFELVGEVR